MKQMEGSFNTTCRGEKKLSPVYDGFAYGHFGMIPNGMIAGKSNDTPKEPPVRPSPGLSKTF